MGGRGAREGVGRGRGRGPTSSLPSPRPWTKRLGLPRGSECISLAANLKTIRFYKDSPRTEIKTVFSSLPQSRACV